MTEEQPLHHFHNKYDSGIIKRQVGVGVMQADQLIKYKYLKYLHTKYAKQQHTSTYIYLSKCLAKFINITFSVSY
jgi:uncharacterized protein (DUF2132 family)